MENVNKIHVPEAVEATFVNENKAFGAVHDNSMYKAVTLATDNSNGMSIAKMRTDGKSAESDDNCRASPENMHYVEDVMAVMVDPGSMKASEGCDR